MKTSKKKSLSRLNTNGSIIYVKNESNCFFVAIYFGILYLQLQTNQALRLNKSDTSQNHKKYLDEMNEALYTTILTASVNATAFAWFNFIWFVPICALAIYGKKLRSFQLYYLAFTMGSFTMLYF